MDNQSTKKLSVVIFSAGVARRMYPLTGNMPKNLIKITDHKTILDFQLEAIKKCPQIDAIIIVVGFEHQQIRDHIFANHAELPIKFILNPFFEVSGNIISSWLSLKEINGAVITINGDDVFSERVIQTLSIDPRDIVLSVSKSSIFDEDDMKVMLDKNNNVVTEIGKHIDLTSADAESLGIIKYSQKGVTKFLSTFESMMASYHQHIGSYYLAVIQTLIEKGNKIYFSEFDANEWREFDYKEDLESFKKDHLSGKLVGSVFYEE